MRVLVIGATGFIGRRLVPALQAVGHTVVAASRHAAASTPASRQVDFSRLLRPEDWSPVLRDVDAVINAVGIFRADAQRTLQLMHVDAPRALFEACVACGVARVVQISALGADDAAASAYHVTKRAADQALLCLPLAATVVQPSLVFGSDGASARMFSTWAALPVVLVPGRGDQRIQPVHVDDAVDAIVAVLDDRSTVGKTIPIVGPLPLPLRDYLIELRAALGLARARVWPVPMALVRLVAGWGGRITGGLIDEDALGMLERGNTADPAVIERLLGRAPRPVRHFCDEAPSLWRTSALAGWALPLLRVAVAVVWIVTGILSLGVFPVDQSRELLARVGAQGGMATLLLYGAAVTDLLLGLATLLIPRSGAMWASQMALILGYTALISWRLPEFWLHPFGPILKNVPMLAAIAVLWAMKDTR